MDLWPLVVAGFLLALAVVVLPRWRERYEDAYEDDLEFFRERRPRMWGLVGEVAGGDASEPDPGRCPVCGTENDPAYTFCRDCDSRLPTRDE